MSLRVLLVDDEAPARAKLRRQIQSTAGFVVAAEAASGGDALPLIRALRPDVLFLDIRMPDMDGFEVLQALGDALPGELVFVTAHGDHALRAFEVHAFDYLLKPVSPERLERLLQRLRDRLVPPADLGQRLDSLLDGLPVPSHPARHLMVEHADRAELVAVDSISRIEADRNYLRILRPGGPPHRLRGTLERMQARLDPAHFVRVNRSTLVRLEAITELIAWPDGEYRLVLDDGGRVTWTRHYLDRASSRLLRKL